MHSHTHSLTVDREKKQSLDAEHKEAVHKMEATERLHQFHSMEQRELDQRLNALYTDKGDKIEHLNQELTRCHHGLRELEAQIQTERKDVPNPNGRGKDPAQELKEQIGHDDKFGKSAL